VTFPWLVVLTIHPLEWALVPFRRDNDHYFLCFSLKIVRRA
jgi:hypothetical protein